MEIKKLSAKAKDLGVVKNGKFEVRTIIDEDENIWIDAYDVARKMCINDPYHFIYNNIDDMDKIKVVYKDYKTTPLKTIWKGNDFSHKVFVNEAGFYTLILKAHTKEAKEFKYWVTHEVLPSIRKNGGYIYGQEHLEKSKKYALVEKLREAKKLVDEYRALYENTEYKLNKVSEQKNNVTKLCEESENLVFKLYDKISENDEKILTLESDIRKLKSKLKSFEPEPESLEETVTVTSSRLNEPRVELISRVDVKTGLVEYIERVIA